MMCDYEYKKNTVYFDFHFLVQLIPSPSFSGTGIGNKNGSIQYLPNTDLRFAPKSSEYILLPLTSSYEVCPRMIINICQAK